MLAALLEVGGDALIRVGLRGPGYWIVAGALTLFAYGVLVNLSGFGFQPPDGDLHRGLLRSIASDLVHSLSNKSRTTE